MYNRYIRDADGTYRREIMRKETNDTPPPSCPAEQPLPQKQTVQRTSGICRPPIETGDLLVLIILLLILAEGEENDKIALLITIGAFIMMQ